MKNIIYRSVIVPAGKSTDGETPDLVVVTEEVNGFGVFYWGYDGTDLSQWFQGHQRDAAIEYAVDYARTQRKLYARDKEQVE